MASIVLHGGKLGEWKGTEPTHDLDSQMTRVVHQYEIAAAALDRITRAGPRPGLARRARACCVRVSNPRS